MFLLKALFDTCVTIKGLLSFKSFGAKVTIKGLLFVKNYNTCITIKGLLPFISFVYVNVNNVIIKENKKEGCTENLLGPDNNIEAFYEYFTEK